MPLRLHFLNVGKGNCTLIDFPSRRLSIIDIDDSRAVTNLEKLALAAKKISLTDPVDYLLRWFPNRPIFRFILTHPDMDHTSGLYRMARRVKIMNFWDTDHDKTISPADWENSPYAKEDWDTYLSFRRSSSNPKALRLLRDATSNCCWIQDGITILSPTMELVEWANETEEYHHLSYVLRVEYAGRTVMLGGDASKEVWQDIIESYNEDFLKADIFLAPHHGSPNNVNLDALGVIDPDLIIVSVAVGVDYDYEAYSRFGKVLSTKYYGNIWVEIREDGRIRYDVGRV